MGKILDNPEEFRMAVGQAQLAGQDYVEVSERLFRYLTKNSGDEALTYGDPGIHVFKAGTRDRIEAKRGLSAERFHEELYKKI